MKLSDFNEVKRLIEEIDDYDECILQVNSALNGITEDYGNYITVNLGGVVDVYINPNTKDKLLKSMIGILSNQKQECIDRLAELGVEV